MSDSPEPWTSLKLIQWTTGYFEKKGIPNPRLDAELLLAHVLNCKRVDLYTGFEKTVPEKYLTTFRTFVERRAKREPLQYLIGETEFWGLKVKVTPDVLIPRSETELLVEEALRTSPPTPLLNKERVAGESRTGEVQILEIGTGSGCIAIALAKNLPEAKITATDISKEALAVAKENAEKNEVTDRIEFILADIAPWKIFEAEGRLFDLIISNPPYIPSGEFPNLQPEVRDFEPHRALDGGPEGMDVIWKIIEESGNFLKPGGILLLEIGEGQAQKILRKRKAEVRKDYNGHERIVVLRRD